MSSRVLILNVALLVCAMGFVDAAGCRPQFKEPAPPATGNLPPLYPRTAIKDPKVVEAVTQFAAWVKTQQVDGKAMFSRIEILPPVPTLEPYGIGTYQRVLRLPVVLTTGAGWTGLPIDQREELTAAAFTDLSDRLSSENLDPTVTPTVTIQTPDGVELAWVNHINWTAPTSSRFVDFYKPETQASEFDLTRSLACASGLY